MRTNTNINFVQAENPSVPIVKSENLSFKFRKGGFSLEDISIECKPSEITGIVGENANGKSTLLKILTGN